MSEFSDKCDMLNGDTLMNILGALSVIDTRDFSYIFDKAAAYCDERAKLASEHGLTLAASREWAERANTLRRRSVEEKGRAA